jgi:hypothetical protein
MSTIEQPKGGRWPWRSLMPTTLEEAMAYRARAADAGYSRAVVGGFFNWCLEHAEGVAPPARSGTDTRYRRMLVELAPAEKLEHLTHAA